jgi:hypothetical protein
MSVSDWLVASAEPRDSGTADQAARKLVPFVVFGDSITEQPDGTVTAMDPSAQRCPADRAVSFTQQRGGGMSIHNARPAPDRGRRWLDDLYQLDCGDQGLAVPGSGARPGAPRPRPAA